MYEPHPAFQSLDDDTRLWRYLGFAQFVNLLERRALFFSRGDRFDDPWEGRRSPESFQETADLVAEALNQSGFSADVAAKARQIVGHQLDLQEQFREWVAINCWHANAEQSAAMWSLYSRGANDDGIAVCTTFKRLCTSFAADDQPIFVGAVDYGEQSAGIENFFRPFVFKRKSFEHENEVRAILMRAPRSENGQVVDQMEFGVYVEIDLVTLVDSVIVSPVAPRWIHELSQRVVGVSCEPAHAQTRLWLCSS